MESSAISTRLFASGGLFLLTVITGFWILRAGRPISGLRLFVHKMLALATVILTGVILYNLARSTAPGAVEFGAIGTSALLFLSLFLTGAFLSQPTPANRAALWLHRIAPLLAAASAAAAVVLLGR